jgi:gamma-glutamylcyclotransferase (GGCT)/AIG2-like uncharacterized protein YtfP
MHDFASFAYFFLSPGTTRHPMRIFLYGTLLDPRTFAAQAGGSSLLTRLIPAILPNWRRVRLRRARFPTLRRERRARTHGAVLTPSATVLARLSAYEGPRYRLRRVVVTTARGKIAAFAWIAPGGTHSPWKG